MRSIKMIAGAMAATASLYIPSALSAPPVVYSGSGANATTALDAFRAAIGGAKNAAGPQDSGRREISWDGVKLDGTDANPNTQVVDSGHTVIIPVDRFRAQGALFEDPYAVSGDGFASVNPGTAGQFPAFSPNNTFVMQDETPVPVRRSLHRSKLHHSRHGDGGRHTWFRCNFYRCGKSRKQQH